MCKLAQSKVWQQQLRLATVTGTEERIFHVQLSRYLKYCQPKNGIVVQYNNKVSTFMG